MFRTYYRLTKPGIVYGNLLSAAAGFFLASQGNPKLGLFVTTLLGIALLIASSCVFNNYLDRHIDAHMKRTRRRALVTGAVSSQRALMFGVGLAGLGYALLATQTNGLTVALGFVAMLFYIAVYGYVKRHSVYGTLVGTIPGALPPVAAYTAVTNHIDGGAAILFAILVTWQVPHFYAISIFRMKEYAKAGIPVFPLIKGIYATKVQMVTFIILFTVACLSLTAFGYTGYAFAFLMLMIGLRWLRLAVRGFKTPDDVLWARKVFFFSLIVLLSTSSLMTIDSLLS